MEDEEYEFGIEDFQRIKDMGCNYVVIATPPLMFKILHIVGMRHKPTNEDFISIVNTMANLRELHHLNHLRLDLDYILASASVDEVLAEPEEFLQ